MGRYSENASYEAAVNLNFPLISNGVMKVDEFLAALDQTAGQENDVRPGDTVRGSDHMEIGEVEKVVVATDDIEAYMLVPRGIIFSRDTFIPLDAVVRRAGTDIFINVPKLVVGEMPCGAPPVRAEQQAKRGPPARDVEKLYRSRGPAAYQRHDLDAKE